MNILLFDELQVGMVLDGNFREYDWIEGLRVESKSYDWAVARNINGNDVYLITSKSSLRIKI